MPKSEKYTIWQACLENNMRGLRYFIYNNWSVNEKDGYGRSPLHLSSGMGYKRLVRYLLRRGAEINCKDDIGKTPLHYAVGSNKIDVVRLLVDKGADILAKDVYGWTPLHVAATINDTLYYLLRDMGGDPNQKNNCGLTPFNLWLQEEKNDSRI